MLQGDQRNRCRIILFHTFSTIYTILKKSLSCNNSDHLFYSGVDFVCKNYAKATYLKSISNPPRKIIKQRFLLISRKRKLWHSLFCIELHTHFTPPSWIEASHKYVKQTICLVFYGVRNLLSQVRGTFKYVDLLLTTPVSRGGAKPPSIAKSTFGCPKQNGPTTLGSAESLKSKWVGGGVYFPLKSWNPVKCFFSVLTKPVRNGNIYAHRCIPCFICDQSSQTKYTTNTF